MQCVACAFTGHCGKCGIIDSIDSPGRVLFDKVRQGSFGSVLSDLIFIAVGLNSANSLSGSSHHGVPASVAALALAAFAVWALGLRTVRRHRPVSVTGGAAARSRWRGCPTMAVHRQEPLSHPTLVVPLKLHLRHLLYA